MDDTSESNPEASPPDCGPAPLEDIEQGLDTVDKALAALDGGDLEAAEALAGELDSPRG